MSRSSILTPLFALQVAKARPMLLTIFNTNAETNHACANPVAVFQNCNNTTSTNHSTKKQYQRVVDSICIFRPAWRRASTD